MDEVGARTSKNIHVPKFIEDLKEIERYQRTKNGAVKESAVWSWQS